LLLVTSEGFMAFDGLAANAPATDPSSNAMSVNVAVAVPMRRTFT
jgi:hypothetical protein